MKSREIQEFIEDSFLTDQERELFEEYQREKSQGKLISSADLRAELELANCVVKEIEASKNASEKDFISHEDVLNEFKIK